MIERITRWRPDDYHDVILFHPKLVKRLRKARVGRKISQVNVLFRAFITSDFRSARTEPSQRFFRERGGDDDARGQPEGQVIRWLMLVIHQRHAPDMKRASRSQLSIRVMANG